MKGSLSEPEGAVMMDNRPIQEVLVGRPTLYLIDEYHHDDLSTDANIKWVSSWIDPGEALIGVEGFSGGEDYHPLLALHKDSERPVGLERQIGGYPRFAHALSEKGYRVEGVDSESIQEDILENPMDSAESLSRDPRHESRSKHFVETLLIRANELQEFGDLVLNCGAEHNDDVEKFIYAKSVPDLANYNVRRVTSKEFRSRVGPHSATP